MNTADNIYIHSIKLHNYRQYYGTTNIEFSRNPKRNFTVLEGTNGAGKTNLLNAIYWCLYMKDIKSGQNKQMPVVNTRAISEAGEGKLIFMSVEISFGTPSEKTVVLSRELRAYKKDASKTVVDTNFGPLSQELANPCVRSSFNKWSPEEKKWMTFENDEFRSDEVQVESFMPKSLAEFVFFDGEKLEKFFEFGLEKQTSVKRGIEVISQLELLESVDKHLEYVSNKYRGEGATEGSKTSQLYQEMQDKLQSIQKNSDIIKEKEKLALPLEKRIKDINGLLETSNDTIIRDKRELEKTNESRSKELERDLRTLEDTKKNLIISEFPIVLLEDCLANVINTIRAAVRRKEFPPPISEELCELILTENMCICGSDISKNTRARARVLELQKKAVLEKLQPIANKITNNIPTLRRFEERLSSTAEIDDKIQNKNNELNDVLLKLKDLSDFLSNVDNESIRELHNEREMKQRWLNDLNRDKGYYANMIETDRRIYNEKKRSHDFELSKDKRKGILVNKIKIVEGIQTLLKEVKNGLTNDFRFILERETKRIFFEIIWKKDTFTNVGIDDDFRLSISHKKGYEALGDLSAGESLFLAISFVTALKHIAGIKLPLVLDSPLGKIDGEPRLLCAKHLPAFSTEIGTQITLLLTGTEYRSPVLSEDGESLGSFRSGIEQYIGKEYRLKYDEVEEMTRIE